MKKVLGLVGIVAVLGTGVLWAADFWKQKDSENWTEKEVSRMLTHSPWARKVDVAISRMGQGEEGGRWSRWGRHDRASDFEIYGRNHGMGNSRYSQGRGIFLPSATLTIRWYSALPIRQAVMRARRHDQLSESAEATQWFERVEDRYIVGISGVPPRMFRSHYSPEGSFQANLAEHLKGVSFLGIKGRDPLAAQSVHFGSATPHTVDADTLRFGADLYIAFPREQSHPLIAVGDKEVEFVTQIGGSEIKGRFKLQDMVFDGQLEL